jgi:hypothetical protein
MEDTLDKYFEDARKWKSSVPKSEEKPDDVYRRLDRIELRIDRIERHLQLDGAH